jgi:hypothetical protein
MRIKPSKRRYAANRCLPQVEQIRPPVCLTVMAAVDMNMTGADYLDYYVLMTITNEEHDVQ